MDGGINTYGYAFQNPIRYTDPTSQFVPLAIVGVCAGGGCEALIDLGAATLCAITPSCRNALGNAAEAMGDALSNDDNVVGPGEAWPGNKPKDEPEKREAYVYVDGRPLVLQIMEDSYRNENANGTSNFYYIHPDRLATPPILTDDYGDTV